jgi:hypothetical protein
MGVQFENLTYSSGSSLTLAIDDLAHHRRIALVNPEAPAVDLDSWLNALQRQATPLIQSATRRSDLEAWLDAVELQLGGPDSAPR